MATVTVTRSINAPARDVFQAVADARRFARAISGVTRLDFLSQTTSGVGTRFRQTRMLNGKEMTMELPPPRSRCAWKRGAVVFCPGC